ncbi:MAG: hypothetical protein M1818_005039 [Claussenomyces sp. TS43310]|nr:MAG: hypothetical protein M1818_005039 [Claussenomyces sp. TS43310]
MPSRKKRKSSPPNFSFVTEVFEAKENTWLKMYSGSARRHAAYWGGSARYQREGKRQFTEQQDNANTSVSDADEKDTSSRHNARPALGFFPTPTVRRRVPSKPTNAKAAALPHKTGFGYLHNIEPEHLPRLPSVPFDFRATASPFAAGLVTFDFCGEGFVKQFVMFDHEDYSIMLSGYLLLSYAHYMALTGHRTKTVLLELKSQVLRRIGAKLTSSDGWLSPRCLTAILALGAPIVCLASQDLPKGLSIWEYINASQQDDDVCCSLESADTAQSAPKERIVHQQAMRQLFLKSKVRSRDADSLALLQYVSNYMNMYASFKSFYSLAIVS